MSLSNKEKEQLDRRINNIKDIQTFLTEKEKTEKEKTEEYKYPFEWDVENLSVVLTYLSAENLVKHSGRLTGLTVALIIFAIAQIVVIILAACEII